jgi:vacuolar-type H+-ATPase subunit H
MEAGMVKAMPDQSSAANEHAILQEITAPLETLPDDPVPVVADVHFPLALRGYDRLAVDAYVKKTSQLVAELQATRSPEAAIRRALERVGQEVSGILKRAHETASEITAQSRREAEDRLEVARTEAAELVAGAQQHVKDLDSDTDRIWAERHRIVGDTQGLAQELLALAESAGERFPPGEAEPLAVDDETVAVEDDGVEDDGVADDGVEDDGVADDGVEDDALALDEEPAAVEPEFGESTEPEPDEDPGTDVTAVLPPLRPEPDEDDR